MKLTIRRGATLMDPIPIGVRANGDLAHEVVCTRSGGVHKLISGMTGSGKSFGEKPVLLTCAALQADQILIDPVKGIQSYASIAGALQMYEIDHGRTRRLLARLMNHTLPARTNHLSREGLTEWDPKRSSLRFLIVHIEEAWKLMEAKALVGLGVALRSAGGRLIVSLQQPTWDQMPTVLRNQMGAYRAYGLADRDYNEFSLPEDVIKAGANPAQWGNEDPGMHYCVMPRQPIGIKSLPVRAWDDGTGDNTFAAAADYVARNLGPMCPVTAESLGDLWTSRVAPLDLVRQREPLVPGPALAGALATLGATIDPAEEDSSAAQVSAQDTEEDFDDLEARNDPEYLAALAEFADLDAPDFVDDDEITYTHDDDGNLVITDADGDEFLIELDDMDNDIDELIDGPPDPDVTRLIGDPPRDGVTREEFHKLLEGRVQAFLASDDEVLERRSFVKAQADCGWSWASVHKYLNRHPQLVKIEGGWNSGWQRVTAGTLVTSGATG
jgi:hypothetical protein